jgi:hypothetical protein
MTGPIAKGTKTKTPQDTPCADSHSKVDTKLQALMQYMKARGLCFKCGGKWGPQHKCPPNVPLTMIEEVKALCLVLVISDNA